jgi:hypothetical protein
MFRPGTTIKDGRFTVISEWGEGVTLPKLRWFVLDVSKSRPNVDSMGMNYRNLVEGRRVFLEWKKEPQHRYCVFGSESLYTYGLYQNAESHIFMFEMTVQTLTSFVEVTSDDIQV